MEFDRVHPSHKGPNTVYLTRVQVAELIKQAGHRHVLDLPCGTGALTQLLLDRGIDVTPADLNPDGFMITGRSCVRADLNASLPFESAQFDAMACIEGIEHIENPHLLAREANRVLRPGGRLYVTTPNVLSIRSRLSYLLRGYPEQFHYMIEVDPATGKEQPIAHINPIGFLELRYTLNRWGFRVDLVKTNQYNKRESPLYRLLRLLLLTRGKRSAASHVKIAEVRRTLLSDEVLFGEGLIVGATKVLGGE
ncbi:MAG: class I SAM-dependent methyltransferase [Nitrospirota bacterium]